MFVEALQSCEFLVFVSTRTANATSTIKRIISSWLHGARRKHVPGMPAAREKKTPPLLIGRAGFVGWSWLSRLDRGGNGGGGGACIKTFTVELGRDVSAWRDGVGGQFRENLLFLSAARQLIVAVEIAPRQEPGVAVELAVFP